MNKKWYNVELEYSDAEKFRKFLKENFVRYEPSAIDGWGIHFEVFEDKNEFDKTEQFLETL